MRREYPYLKDLTFLKKLDNVRNRTETARITLLDQKENPIKEITDRIISGSINVSGTSVVRRNGSLVVLADPVENDLTDISSLISINKRIYLEIGIQNTVDTDLYDEIIWFPMGVFVITACSISHQAESLQISVTIEDKMGLLNGDISGVIPASVTLDEVETVDALGITTVEKPTIYQIIQELVHHYGGEDQSRIYINDIDTKVRRVMKYMGNDSVYLIENHTSKGVDSFKITKNKDAPSSAAVVEIKTGEDIGYIYDDFTYPEELVAKPGDTITSILDQIKEKLGNYEYFYDVYGNFIFQEIKNYLNTSQSTNIINNLTNSSYQYDFYNGKAAYVLDNKESMISFSNTPNYKDIKNDFIIWGKKNLSSTEDSVTTSIRYHLVIDDKPQTGNTYHVILYTDNYENIRAKYCISNIKSISKLPNPGISDLYYAISPSNIQTWDEEKGEYKRVENAKVVDITTKDWREELYYSGLQAVALATSKNAYYTELVEEFPKQYNLETQMWKESTLTTPSSLDYFLDFISGAEVSQFSVSAIGRRSNVEEQEDINCLFLPNIPDYILIDGELTSKEQESQIAECTAKGYKYIIVEKDIYDEFYNGGNSYSAYEYIQSILYQKVSYNEQISIEMLPAFYMEPNSRITVSDETTGIKGDYIINTISFTLGVKSNSTLSCSRAMQRI